MVPADCTGRLAPSSRNAQTSAWRCAWRCAGRGAPWRCAAW